MICHVIGREALELGQTPGHVDRRGRLDPTIGSAFLEGE
jgi:hypothetical protein